MVEECDREYGGLPGVSQPHHPQHRCEAQRLWDPARLCVQGSSESHRSQRNADPLPSSLTRCFRKYPVSIKCFY